MPNEGETLKSIVSFANVAAGAQMTHPHGLTNAGVALVPDQVTVQHPSFSHVTSTPTDITVRNDGLAPASCNVLCEAWHPVERQFGEHPGEFSERLSVQPFSAEATSSVAAQIRVTAHTDNVGAISYMASAITLTGGMVFGGIDLLSAPGYVRLILTLPAALDDSNKVPLTGLHMPTVPPGPIGETVFLYVPPIPIQPDGVSADASVLVPIFGKGINNTDEIIDITYELSLAS